MAFSHIQERVKEACLKHNRDLNSVKLVAVSKYQPIEALRAVYEQGGRDFGESRVQEWLEKKEGCPQDVRWHFIGTLQKNKVNKIVGKTHLIHSVDSLELAQKISQATLERQLAPSSILLQVNTSAEPQKHGLSCEQWVEKWEEILELSGVAVKGLMTMAPLTQDEALISSCFAKLRCFREELQRRAGGAAQMKELSMGMSQDYLLAIQEGATLLRIGRALF